MNIEKISILLAGCLTLIIAIMHVFFGKIFKWKHEFQKLNDVNHKIVNTIHIALTILLFALAYISISYAREISSESGLANAILIGLCIFWAWRTLWQIFYFKPTRKTHGMKLVTMHYSLIIVFLALFMFYLTPIFI